MVGRQGEQVHLDAWGRIKIQFLFSRPQDNTHSGGAGSSGTDSDSAWVDVLTPWAGDGASSYGARFLPRAGELVAIDFFDGNADRPFVLGRIHEGSRLPAQFDHQGTLPDTKALSGIKSQEINGQGFNQLRFDDTSGQISAQLQSSHGASQLNLGNLIHPRSNEEAESRGEGFELRTDQCGAVRAGKGLLISTDEQLEAKGEQLNIKSAIEQLEMALELAKRLDRAASEANANNEGQKYIRYGGLQQQLNNGLTDFKQASVMIYSASDIAILSPKSHTYNTADSMTFIAAKQIDFNALEHYTVSAAKGLSLYAQENGAKVIANQGALVLQAQNDVMQLASLKDCTISSSQGKVTVAAKKELVLICGSGYIKIKSNGSIEMGSPSVIDIKGSLIKFLSSASTSHQFEPFKLINFDGNKSHQFKAIHPQTGEALISTLYLIKASNGKTYSGTTDEEGLTERVHTLDEEELEVFFGAEADEILSSESDAGLV